MAIPMGSLPRLQGTPPQEALDSIVWLKYAVLAMWIAALGRLLTGDAFGSLNDVFSAVVGTFLLKDDPQFAPCANCLMETPIGVCAGNTGWSCLPMFMVLTGMNGLFDTFRVLLLGGRLGYDAPIVIFLILSAVSGWVGMYIAFRVIKVWMRPGPMDGAGGDPYAVGGFGRFGGANSYFNTGAGVTAPSAQEMQDRPQPSTGTSWQAFQGTGHRLGQ
mmetsp:Transcript_45261/g.119444  ORF Transcript_45261/g.119444 Transcript_45261/m.119444 type:complete len:217 (-) Transcript_45261:255-905(-)